MTPARWILTLFMVTAALSAVAIAFTRPSPMLAVVGVTLGDRPGSATGFAVDGHTVVTNRHVAENEFGEIRELGVVTLLGGKAIVKSVWLDPDNDLAVLTVAPAMPHWLPVVCDWPERGTAITAYGHPMAVRWGAYKGRVASDLAWADGLSVVLDITSGKGMSGGPALDWRGRVRAVVAAGIGDTSGIVFAVPGRAVCRALKESRADG